MSAQSFGGAHRGRVCVCAFIGVSVCAYIRALVTVQMFKKETDEYLQASGPVQWIFFLICIWLFAC